ncbi:MAG: hypothetical protein WC894_00970 [Patescibacteria group bacterium]
MNQNIFEVEQKLIRAKNRDKNFPDTLKSMLLKTPAMGLATVGILTALTQLPELTHLGLKFANGDLSLLQSVQPLTAIAQSGLHEVVNFAQSLAPAVGESIQKGGLIGYGVGAAIGLIQNGLLIDNTFTNLKNVGGTSPSTGEPASSSEDIEGGKIKIFHLRCADSRIKNKDGLNFAGSFAMFGAEFRSIIQSGIAAKLINPHSNLVADIIAGYYFGSNIATTGFALGSLIKQIRECMLIAKADPNNPNPRIKIIMEDHSEGCGANGFTSILENRLKFSAHNLWHLADLAAVPNEVLGLHGHKLFSCSWCLFSDQRSSKFNSYSQTFRNA